MLDVIVRYLKIDDAVLETEHQDRQQQRHRKVRDQQVDHRTQRPRSPPSTRAGSACAEGIGW